MSRHLADAQRRHREADHDVESAKARRLAFADECVSLGQARGRLLTALGEAVAREAGLGGAADAQEPQNGSPRVSATPGDTVAVDWGG